MEKLARKIADKLSNELHYDEEKREVIAYGFIALGQSAATILLVLAISLLAGMPVEALIISFSVSLLRKYSGGAHLNSMELCTFIGVLYSVAAAALTKYLIAPRLGVYQMTAIVALCFAVSYCAVYKFAPVASPSKPIKTEKKIRRMRRGSFIMLSFYLAVSILFVFLGQTYPSFFSYGISLLWGIVWQIFTLTSLGAQFFLILDHVGNRIFDI